MARPANPDKSALLAELAAARSRLSAIGRALRSAIDVPSKAKESFHKHRPTWLGGAALLGLVLSRLPARRKTVFVERATGKAIGAAARLGFLWPALKLAFDLAMPVVSEAATRHFGDLRRKFGRSADERNQTGYGSRP